MKLGNYEITTKLGEGGMGEVYRAHDARLNRSVAVKILAQGTRFEQEAKALGALNHPNIVAIYDAGQDNGSFYIVSELVDGESLRTVIERGRIPTRKLIDFATQIADALAAAHAVGIVHRDLKPENVMITREGRVKVLDFGLAKQIVPTSENTATIALSTPGMVMGTVGYMSPEQVRGEPLDHRSDIFSFGCVLYEMVAGTRAFSAPSSVETMNAIIHDDPAEQPVDPPALNTIIRRCLEKRPDQRFQSAADLAFALRSLTPASTTSAQAIKAAPPRNYRTPAIAAAAVALAFIAGYLLSNRLQHRAPPNFQRITFRRGLVTNARFTSDGRNIVYSANWDGAPGGVFLAIPGNPESRDLGMPPNSILLSVSSKDETAFLMGPYSKDGSGTLSRESISGGQMRPWIDGVFGADWSPDGSTMAVYRIVNGKRRLEYPVGNVVLDNPKTLLLGMRVSPDGNNIVYGRFDRGNSVALDIVDKAGKVRTLGVVSGETPDIVDPVLNWSPDGKEIWFRSYDVKEWGTIYAVDMKGRKRIVSRLPGHVTVYDIARDGKVLLRTDTRQVGILGMAPGETMERDLSCLDNADLSGISDDGQTILATIIGESGGPKGSVYLRKMDGSAPIRVSDGAALALSPDGKWVSAFTAVKDGSRRYVVLPTGAGEERVIRIPGLDDVNLVYGWSNDDGNFFLHGLAKSDKSKMQNYVWNPDSGELRPIGPEGVADDLPILSPDRHQILDVGPDGQWWVYPIDGGQAHPVNGLGHHDRVIGWREDNRSIFISTHRDVNQTIPVSILDLTTGQKTPWKELRASRAVDETYNVAITPNGRAWAYNFRVKLSDLYIATGL